jgi:hypothetical protein
MGNGISDGKKINPNHPTLEILYGTGNFIRHSPLPRFSLESQ